MKNTSYDCMASTMYIVDAKIYTLEDIRQFLIFKVRNLYYCTVIKSDIVPILIVIFQPDHAAVARQLVDWMRMNLDEKIVVEVEFVVGDETFDQNLDFEN